MPPDAKTPRRPRPWLLIASLMVNLLVLGAAAGAILAPRHGGPWPHHGERKGPLTRFVETLPPARSAELKSILGAEREALEQSRGAMREARRGAMEAATREPYDRAALDAALARFGAADANVRDGRAKKFAETISAMTPEERKRFLDWTSRKRHGHGWRPFGWGGHRGQEQERE